MTVATPAPTTEVAVPAGASAISAAVARYTADLKGCMQLAAEIVDTPIVPVSFWPLVALRRGDQVQVLKAWEWEPNRRHPQESEAEFAYRRDVAIATTGGVIHVGASLGHESYFQSITGIYFVGGRPALMSEEMRAQVLAAGHTMRVVTRAEDEAEVLCLRRGETGEPRPYRFTMAMAVKAGYVKGQGPNTNNKRGNDKYNTDPATMLLARVTTIACRIEFPDVIRGMVAAEVARDDDEPVDVTATTTVTRVSADDITAAAPKALTVTVSGKVASGEDITEPIRKYAAEHAAPTATPAAASPAARAPQEPEVVAEVGPAATSPDVERTITDKQWRDINAAFVKLGVTGPGQSEKRLAVLSDITARPIARGSELSEADADLALSMLTAEESKQYVRDVLVGKAIEGQPVEPAVEQSAADQQAEAEQTYASSAEPDLEPQADDPWNGQGE